MRDEERMLQERKKDLWEEERGTERDGNGKLDERGGGE